MGFLTGWSYRTRITVTETSGTTLLNQQIGPFVIQGNDPDASNYVDFSFFQSDGADLRITKVDGTTIMNHWHFNWDSVGKTANLFFKADILVAYSNTDFFIYGGNSGASSTSSYKDTMTKVPDDIDGGVAIWHLDEGSGEITDSSGNNQNSYMNDWAWLGSDGGGYKGDTTYNFDGNCVKADSGTPTIEQAKFYHDDIWNDMALEGTIGALVKFTSSGLPSAILYKGNGSNPAFAVFEIYRDFQDYVNILWGNTVTSKGIRSISKLNENTWYHLIFTWKEKDVSIYINAVLDNTGTMDFNMVPRSTDIILGNDIAGNNFKNGNVDEVFALSRQIDASEAASLYGRIKHTDSPPTWTISAFGSYDHDSDFEIPVTIELGEFSHDSDFNIIASNPNESLVGDFDHDTDFDAILVLGEFSHDSDFDVLASNPNESLEGNYDHDSNLDEIGVFGKYEHDSNINFFTSNPNESLLGSYDHDSDILSIPSAEDLEGLFDHDTDYDEFIYFPIESDIIIQVNSKFANEFTVSSKFSNSIEINSKITDFINVDSEIF